jgi:dTDP-4-amino-4,6-dideoxygalactose transaminase
MENLDDIQKKRIQHWNTYKNSLINWADDCNIQLPYVPVYATNNAHMFYMVCRDSGQRTKLIRKLKDNNILAVFHYLSLHKSPFFKSKHDRRILQECDRYSDCLVRLPLFYELKIDNIFLSKFLD